MLAKLISFFLICLCSNAMAKEMIVVGDTGRLFLTSSDSKKPWQMIDSACSINDAAKHAREVERLISHAKAYSPNVAFLSIPPPFLLHSRELPGFLSKRCNQYTSLGRKLEELLTEKQVKFVHPLKFMETDVNAEQAYPIFNFHWDGAGVHRVVKHFSTQHLGFPPQVTMQLRESMKDADLQPFPSVKLRSAVLNPDIVSAGVKARIGNDASELGKAGVVLRDVRILKTLLPIKRKLLLVSDSFGGIASYSFSETFSEVIHFSTSFLGELDQTSRSELRRFIKEVKPDAIVFLYQDAALRTAVRSVDRLLFNDP
jgi:hypothetical protein